MDLQRGLFLTPPSPSPPPFSASMLSRRAFTALARSFRPFSRSVAGTPTSAATAVAIPGRFSDRSRLLPARTQLKKFDRPALAMASPSASSSAPAPTEGSLRRAPFAPLPPSSADKGELYKGLEAAIGTPFSSDPSVPPPNPVILVISGPSGVGKDAVIKRLLEVREGIHFLVTATSRPQRPGEVDGKDYYFVSKEEFLSMVEREELLEYALVYGDYKGIPKQQIRDFMAKGFDIVLRVDIQGAATLRSILGNSAVFIFLVAETEEALVKRLVARKTETTEMLLVRIATAKEEMKHLKDFDYVVVNAEGKLDGAVKLVGSIIDAEKARVRQREIRI